MNKIVVDAMGGDNAPAEIVKGALEALEAKKDFAVIFTGDEEMIKAELANAKYDASRVEIVHCTEVITNDDDPAYAIRRKKDSSVVVGMKLLKEKDDCIGFVSAGSTGAVLAGAMFIVKRIDGVLRPALCPALPNVRGTQTLLCDCGANAECKPQYLEQFGIMAAAYAKAAFGVQNPRVGLLNNGTEDHKGDPLHQETNKLMKQLTCIDYAGNVEGRDIVYGDVDVVVCDGFSGNIALKSIEGTGKLVGKLLSEKIKSTPISALGGLLMMKQLKEFKNTLDYSRFGGSVFLGVQKVVVKSHGSSKAKSICASIKQALEAHENNLIENIGAMIKQTLEEEAKRAEATPAAEGSAE